MISEPQAKRIRTQATEQGADSKERSDTDEDSSDSDSSEDSSSDGSDMGDVQLDEEFAEEAGSAEVVQPKFTDGSVIYMHKLYGTLHARRLDDSSRFKCGKLLSDSYSKADKVLRCAWPECKMCFGTRNVE